MEKLKIDKENWKYITVKWLRHAKNNLDLHQNKSNSEILALIDFIEHKLK